MSQTRGIKRRKKEGRKGCGKRRRTVRLVGTLENGPKRVSKAKKKCT